MFQSSPLPQFYYHELNLARGGLETGLRVRVVWCLLLQAINEVLVGTSAPVRVVSGYIGHVTVSVPWTALLKDSCKVEISGLALSIVPHIAPSTTTDEPGG